MSYLITPQILVNLLQKEKVVLLDVRSDLQDPNIGEEAYKKSHLPGAFYLHLERDLSGEVGKHGGNHPLPLIDKFISTLANLGINNGTTVVIYDTANEMYAPRAWWLLHYLGLEKVYVLDGGFTAWVNSGLDITNKIPQAEPTTFEPNILPNATVTMEDVRDRRADAVLIDSRAPERYLGLEEPLYHKAGHIPGAKNYFWQDVLNETGNWKNSAELAEHFRNVPKDQTVIVSCGSGVSACPNILALKSLGYEDVRLYPGSFSDWISYEENQLETKED